MTTKPTIQNDASEEMTALRSAALSQEDVPRRVLLAPWGTVQSTKGSFVVDEESARLAAEAFEAHGADLPIDYEHQTLGGGYASPSGQAPAAGWIKRLIVEPGSGLFADIEWTPQGRKLLAAKEYRYLSPVAVVRRSDRKLVAIHSAALTNKPAILHMTPIVNRDDIRVVDDAQCALAALKAELDLPDESAFEEVLFEANKRIRDLHDAHRRRHVEGRIMEAMQAGKLVEAQRAWAEELVAREEALFDEWLRTAPVVVVPGRSAPPSGHDGNEQRRDVIARRARAEYAGSAMLQRFTSEEAYVADALREAKCT